MTNCPMESVEEYDDINTKAEYALALDAGYSREEALEICSRFSRDNGRTPMQWDASENAGFTTGKPWLKVNPNYQKVNAEEQSRRPGSLLNYYKALIALRKAPEYREIFAWGDFEPLWEEKENLLAFRRVLNDADVLIMANFGREEMTIAGPILAGRKVLLSNAEADVQNETVTLAPSQAMVLG